MLTVGVRQHNVRIMIRAAIVDQKSYLGCVFEHEVCFINHAIVRVWFRFSEDAIQTRRSVYFLGTELKMAMT